MQRLSLHASKIGGWGTGARIVARAARKMIDKRNDEPHAAGYSYALYGRLVNMIDTLPNGS